jgi:hypothetical protein
MSDPREIAQRITREIQEAFEQQSFFLPPIMKEKISEILAAHYEPVPDECFICHNDGTPCVHYLKAVSEEQAAEVWPKDGDLCANCGRSEEGCDCHPHPFTPANSDGTPMSPVISYNYPDDHERSAGRIDPQRVAQTNHNIKEQLKNLAPHRATIAPPEQPPPIVTSMTMKYTMRKVKRAKAKLAGAGDKER